MHRIAFPISVAEHKPVKLSFLQENGETLYSMLVVSDKE